MPPLAGPERTEITEISWHTPTIYPAVKHHPNIISLVDANSVCTVRGHKNQHSRLWHYFYLAGKVAMVGTILLESIVVVRPWKHIERSLFWSIVP